MDEILLDAAEEIRARYRAAAHPGLRAGPMDRQFNAGRADAFRESLVILLSRVLRRQPSREEISAWLAGQSPLPVSATPAPDSLNPPKPDAGPLPAEHLSESAIPAG